MKFLKMAAKIIDNINDWVGKTASWLIMPAVVVVVLDVTMRKVFNIGLTWGYDMSLQLIGFFFMFGMGYTLLKDGHVKVDFVSHNFPDKTQAFLNVFLYSLIVIPVLIVFLKGGTDYAVISWKTKETMGVTTWNPPIYPFKAVIPFSFFLLTIQAVSEIFKNVIVFMGRTEE